MTAHVMSHDSPHLLHGGVNHVNEEEGNSLVVNVLDLPVVLVNVMLDTLPVE